MFIQFILFNDTWFNYNIDPNNIKYSDTNTNGGNINILAGEKGTGGSDGIAGLIQIRGNIIPESTETYDIGSSTKKFRDIFSSVDIRQKLYSNFKIFTLE